MSTKIRPWTASLLAAALMPLMSSTDVLAQEPPLSGPAKVSEFSAQCTGKNGFADPAPPVHVYGNTYYVGTCGIAAVLIEGPAGDILIDDTPKQSAASVIANLRRLGVKPTDVRVLLSTHEHYDHAGGLAELKRVTRATLYARAAEKPSLESGMPSEADPQRALHQGFPPVNVDRIVRSGGHVRVGPLDLTALATPGHTPGSTSWTWRSCEKNRCVQIVYADSLSAVSADSYRFSDHPGELASFAATFKKIRSLKCDILLTPHPGASDLFARLAGADPLIEPDLCIRYVRSAEADLEKRGRSERQKQDF